MDENETYKSVADDILNVDNIKNYKRYINNIYIEKFLSRLDCKENTFKEDDFKIKILKKICFYPLCLNEVIGDNYCSIHNKDTI